MVDGMASGCLRRKLGYAEFGDPAGQPVVFLHGWCGSRLTRHPDDQLTASLRVRLITVDRPGVLPPTITDPAERRRILQQVVERMMANPLPNNAPKFTRDELHERR